MTYINYCVFYGAAKTADTFEDWLFSEWTHGRAYREGNNFYRVASGKFIGSCR
ncbi:MAG: hypothetical protein LUG99_18620 [Lachnospiraceae bacterium]|nr:hypothetical protein [Lachnospiraceae bacterium]